MSTTSTRIRGSFVAVALAGAAWLMPIGSHAQQNKPGMTHVFITYRCKPADRPAFLAGMENDGIQRFQEYKSKGIVADYLVAFNPLCDEDTWDMTAILKFDTYAQTDKWRDIERTHPGGLSVEMLRIATPITSYFADLRWSAGARGDQKKAIYMAIPYQWSDAALYATYIEAYGVPQFNGWIKEGVLNSWGIFFNHHATGKPWDAYLLFEYKDVEALGNRDVVKQKVRTMLKENAAWKFIQDSKTGIRTELEVVMARPIVAEN